MVAEAGSFLFKVSRYTIPTAESFRGPISEDDFDIDMAKTPEEKQQATNARASKLWRTLRIASKSKLNLLERIDDGNNLQALFQPDEEENREQEEVDGIEKPLNQPASEPIVNGPELKVVVGEEKGAEISPDVAVGSENR